MKHYAYNVRFIITLLTLTLVLLVNITLHVFQMIKRNRIFGKEKFNPIIIIDSLFQTKSWANQKHFRTIMTKTHVIYLMLIIRSASNVKVMIMQ